MDLSKILVAVIDDNQTVRHIVSGILHKFKVGHIVEAENGADALEKFSVVQPDIIFCDWLMQPIDGLEFVRRVRAGEGRINRDTPIVMMTSQVEAAKVLEAKQAGVSSYLVKPIMPGALMARLAMHLGGIVGTAQPQPKKRPIQLVG